MKKLRGPDPRVSLNLPARRQVILAEARPRWIAICDATHKLQLSAQILITCAHARWFPLVHLSNGGVARGMRSLARAASPELMEGDHETSLGLDRGSAHVPVGVSGA